MSFIYAGTDTASLAGVTATLTQWPSLGGLAADSVEVPGRHGRIFGGATRTASRFEYDVIVEGSTPQQAGERRDAFIALLDPDAGPQTLQLETDDAWQHPDVLVADEVNWKQAGWDHGIGFRLRATVALETQGEPSARQVDPAEVSIFSGGVDYTLDLGNTSAYPRVRFTPTNDSGGRDITIGIGDFTITVEGGVPGGQVLDLDWDAVSFYRTNAAGRRLESVVGRMSTYQRPRIRPGQTVRLTRSSGASSATFYPNARRI